MKHVLYLFCFFFSLSFHIYGGNTYPQLLLLADSLTRSKPDSAVSLLISMKEDLLVQSEETQMCYNLLCVRVDDKRCILQVSDSLILSILHYYINRDDKQHLSEAYFYAGRMYRNLGDFPQAQNCYDNALEALEGDSCYRLRNLIYGQMGGLCSEQGFWNEAKEIYLRAYKWNSIATDFYYDIGNMDSMFYYYKELLGFSTLYLNADAYSHLVKFASKEGKAQNVGYVDKQPISYNNYALREKENSRLKKENKQKQFYLICLVTGIAIVLLCFSAYFRYGRRKYVRLRLQLLQLKQAKEEQCPKNDRLIEAKKTKHYAEKQVELCLQLEKQVQRTLLNSDICKYFREICRNNADTQVSYEDWNLLEETVDSIYKGFAERLFQIHRVSELELRICLLIKIGISPKDMARLTNHSRESITSVRRRLYEKFFGRKGTPQQWDEFIDSL